MSGRLEFALGMGEQHGIFGGYTAAERQDMRQVSGI